MNSWRSRRSAPPPDTAVYLDDYRRPPCAWIVRARTAEELASPVYTELILAELHLAGIKAADATIHIQDVGNNARIEMGGEQG